MGIMKPEGLGVAPVQRHSTMGSSFTLVGDVLSRQDLLIEGVIRGNLDLPDHALTIAHGARVEGKVFARAVTVAGAFAGAITATTRVAVVDRAEVSGEITSPRLIVEDGARVTARVDTMRTESAVKVARYRLEKRLTEQLAG
jgi:cytoskeletal protein CcmA (bactofilin family)